MDERKAGGGGAPGADLSNPRSPRYKADLTGVAVRLPTDRINLLLSIVESRNERLLRDGGSSKIKLSELIRHVFDLGMYELQVQEAVNRWVRKNRTHTFREIADAVRLPEEQLRREFRARGIDLPPPAPPTPSA
jgi:hypothetical protein